MTIRRELIIDFSELGRMVIPCPKCETQMTITVQNTTAPQECPSCGVEYDEAFREAINTFRQAYRKLVDPKVPKVQFRIAAPEEP